MAYTICPFPFHQFFDQNGKPAAGYRLFSYDAGTSTKRSTYGDTNATAAANPIVLDSAGRPPLPIYLSPHSFKFVLAPPGTDDPPTSTEWSADNVSATPSFNVDLDVTGTAGETLTENECVYLSDGSGGRTAGRWYKTDQDTPAFSTLARVVGFATVAAGAAGSSVTVRRGGRLTGMSGLTAGSLYYISATAGAITSTAPANARRVAQADSTTSILIASEIEEPIKGYIPIDLSVFREVAANVTQNAAANGGLLASDTTPAYERVNAATDKALRINWVAANVDEITASFSYPPDLDDTNAVEVHILAASGGATNSPTIAVGYFEGVGDTNAGGNTAAVTGTTVAEYSVTIAAADIGTHPNFASVSLTPAAHGTDALRLYAVWIEYTRLLKAS